jgi:hypothetical protein
MTPQTRQEFVQMNVKGAAFSMVDSHVAHRSFDTVVRNLKNKSAECLDTNVTTRRTENGMPTMNVKDEFRTTVRVVSANRAELTTQYRSKGITYAQKVPEGGFYRRAVDIVRLSANTTKLTYYGSSFDSSKKIWATIKQWSDGESAPCP